MTVLNHQKQAPKNYQEYSTGLNQKTNPLQIRRRIKQKHSLSILVRQNSTKRLFCQLSETLILDTLVKHIRAEIPIRPSLVDGIPLVFLREIRAAEIVAVAGWYEIEVRRAVWAESTFVRGPVEAGGGFGGAGGFEFCDTWRREMGC